MNKLKIRKQEKRAQALKEKKYARMYAIYAIVCFICGVYSARTYKQTVIPFDDVLVLFLTIGIPFAVLTLKYKKEIFNNDFRLIRDFLLSVYGFGSIGLTLFFITNNYFTENKLHKENFYILQSHEENRSSPNSVEINIDSTQKEINLPDNTISEIDNADFITITYVKGLFGYLVIIDKDLVKD
jgi:hypothetical protein